MQCHPLAELHAHGHLGPTMRVLRVRLKPPRWPSAGRPPRLAALVPWFLPAFREVPNVRRRGGARQNRCVPSRAALRPHLYPQNLNPDKFTGFLGPCLVLRTILPGARPGTSVARSVAGIPRGMPEGSQRVGQVGAPRGITLGPASRPSAAGGTPNVTKSWGGPGFAASLVSLLADTGVTRSVLECGRPPPLWPTGAEARAELGSRSWSWLGKRRRTGALQNLPAGRRHRPGEKRG